MTRWKLALYITLAVMALVIAGVWAGTHAGPMDDDDCADDDDSSGIPWDDDVFDEDPYNPGVL